MLFNERLRPVLASAAAAAVVCWPVLPAALREITSAGRFLPHDVESGDFFGGRNLAFLLFPSAFVASFVLGQVLIMLEKTGVRPYVLTALVAVFPVSLLIVTGQAGSHNWSMAQGISDFLKIFAGFMFSFGPAAICWWYLAAKPRHRRSSQENAAG